MIEERSIVLAKRLIRAGYHRIDVIKLSKVTYSIYYQLKKDFKKRWYSDIYSLEHFKPRKITIEWIVKDGKLDRGYFKMEKKRGL